MRHSKKGDIQNFSCLAAIGSARSQHATHRTRFPRRLLLPRLEPGQRPRHRLPQGGRLRGFRAVAPGGRRAGPHSLAGVLLDAESFSSGALAASCRPGPEKSPLAGVREPATNRGRGPAPACEVVRSAKNRGCLRRRRSWAWKRASDRAGGRRKKRSRRPSNRTIDWPVELNVPFSFPHSSHLLEDVILSLGPLEPEFASTPGVIRRLRHLQKPHLHQPRYCPRYHDFSC